GLAVKRHKIHWCVCERLCLFAAIPAPSHGSCREWFLRRTSKQQMTSPDVLYRVARFLPPTSDLPAIVRLFDNVVPDVFPNTCSQSAGSLKVYSGRHLPHLAAFL